MSLIRSLILLMLTVMSVSSCAGKISPRHVQYDDNGNQTVTIVDPTGAELETVCEVEDERRANELLAENQRHVRQQGIERQRADLTQAVLARQLEFARVRDDARLTGTTPTIVVINPTECEQGRVRNATRMNRTFWYKIDDGVSEWRGVTIPPGECRRINVAPSATYIIKIDGQRGTIVQRINGQVGEEIRLNTPATPYAVDGEEWYFYYNILS